ncbi:hypothetical protein C7H19_08860 [Aphanothece hegewaldii CCALA 016]|uniref:DUF5678 domain-containing protein n=1 Tax=Aphanothece hegewaldii CCALA 016 TaxID=2107694 RepID=A0A2T1LZ20_9CHRO|nr:hypothetical protein [Aphanothece hegewaldii]PSF37655.1 hypothetical protein C7H19_08860 [Aphanothece hegewaldii CCALA 016]
MSQYIPERVVRRGRIFPEIQWTESKKAQHKARQEAFYQRCWAIFERLKPELLDKYYGWYIAIEPDSGDYFIDSVKEVASQKARNKYPNSIHHIFGINETGVSGRI